MDHNLLLWEGPLLPGTSREREALGLPARLESPGAEWILRLEGLPDRLSRRLAGAARKHGGRGHLMGRPGSRALVLRLSPAALASFRRVLALGSPPLETVSREIEGALGSLHRRPRRIRLARRQLELQGRTLIQGILNVTPDSFFDGGRWSDPTRAVERASQMAREGADLVDVGGESTRPGSRPIPVREEIRRVVPVIEKLAGRLPVPISVDTTKSQVAEAALSAGAELVNDVSGLAFNPALARIAARHGAAVILCHLRGRPRTMQRDPRYRHLLPEVLGFLRGGIRRALAAGVDPESILIDPGIGFGKTAEHNLLLLRHLRVLCGAGHPVVVGASRKSFLGKITGGGPEDRLEGSLAAAALAVFNGASVLRVHDVAASVRVARTAEAVRDARIERAPE